MRTNRVQKCAGVKSLWDARMCGPRPRARGHAAAADVATKNAIDGQAGVAVSREENVVQLSSTAAWKQNRLYSHPNSGAASSQVRTCLQSDYLTCFTQKTGIRVGLRGGEFKITGRISDLADLTCRGRNRAINRRNRIKTGSQHAIPPRPAGADAHPSAAAPRIPCRHGARTIGSFRLL